MPPVNLEDLEWTTTEHGEAKFRRKELGAAAATGDPELGCSLYELPPGAVSWPYHYHTGNAEAMYVLDGHGTVQLAGEEYALAPGDFVPFPRGPVGAHRVRNESEEPLRFLMVSTMREPDVTVYPEMGKFGVYAGSPPGGREDRSLEGYYRIEETVDYWD